MATKQQTSQEIRETLTKLQKKKKSAILERTDSIRYTLEGLRLTRLLQQMQALQAVQGLHELVPAKGQKKQRFEVPSDPEEREQVLQWLHLKADWLEALLEDTVDEIQAIEETAAATLKSGNKSASAPDTKA